MTKQRERVVTGGGALLGTVDRDGLLEVRQEHTFNKVKE